jgi:hypothetical protein
VNRKTRLDLALGQPRVKKIHENQIGNVGIKTCVENMRIKQLNHRHGHILNGMDIAIYVRISVQISNTLSHNPLYFLTKGRKKKKLNQVKYIRAQNWYGNGSGNY